MPGDERLKEPAPPQEMAVADQMGVGIAEGLTDIVNKTIHDVVASNGKQFIPVAELGLLMGFERVRAMILFNIERGGGPVESVNGCLERVNKAVTDNLRERDKSPKIIMPPVRLVKT